MMFNRCFFFYPTQLQPTLSRLFHLTQL